jgi:SAM-dependent methyltransferase
MVYVGSAKKELIFEAVRAMYTDIARHPFRGYHIPTGSAACAFVGYPREPLTQLPASAVDSFAGVGFPFAANVIQAGGTVLDVGSGSGTDALLAARAVGPSGRVIALDLTAAMLAALEAGLAAAGVSNVRAIEGNAERLPLCDASVDVVTSNGVLNLVPDKRAAFAEIHRVLRPGGRLQLADIALGLPLSGDCLSDPRVWAECIVGATREDEYLGLLVAAGFERAETLGRLDYFSASSSPETRAVARSFGACAIVVRAVKAPGPALPPALPWPPASPSVAPPEAPRAPATACAPDAVVDGYGVPCGKLEPMIKDGMRALESGRVLEVWADDPLARAGVPAWCRLAGHALVESIEDGPRTRFLLRKR